MRNMPRDIYCMLKRGKQTPAIPAADAPKKRPAIPAADAPTPPGGSGFAPAASGLRIAGVRCGVFGGECALKSGDFALKSVVFVLLGLWGGPHVFDPALLV